MKYLIILYIVLLIPIQNSAVKVVAVLDGDTIDVLNSQNEKIRIRLNGIDCPEKNQAYGQAAKKLTASLCFGKTVEVIGNKKDRYGRLIAEIILSDKRSLNYLLVEAGLAWHYKKYSTDQNLAALEDSARHNKVGLWQDPYALAPWEFRKQKFYK